ncbi:TRAM domain-containing protein [Halorarum halophilum]|uniref:TRAM domain-containing protein n=1 Tax=Halorarum halophilum TaxID=2743090 RepID=A0A7D5GFU2_9EURY|nr:TRAM domain-containing protein [Halobaculum halophilum]QLG28528.1 TRAM domain-containing protein [Halobaculum halophilum]
MPDCPLADECPRFSERINGMGCQHYGDRGGAEWCNSYDMPISDLKQQPVKPGEEVVLDVEDIHESGAGVGRTEDGFIVMIDGALPPSRVRVRIDRVKQNHATAKEIVEKLPMEGEEGEEGDSDLDEADPASDGEKTSREKEAQRLGSRDNFWGS